MKITNVTVQMVENEIKKLTPEMGQEHSVLLGAILESDSRIINASLNMHELFGGENASTGVLVQGIHIGLALAEAETASPVVENQVAS